MKNIIIFSLLLFFFIECTRNFNPETDSSLCPMNFTFDTEHFFDKVLTCSNGTFSLDTSKSIPEGYVLRIKSYCYDVNGDLIRTDEVRSNSLSSIEIQVPYVFTNNNYKFVFLADFVKEDKSYWYPLSSKTLQTAYMRRSNDENIPLKSKFVFYGEWEGQPISSSISVHMVQASYNCWFILRNLSNLDKVEISLAYYDTFYFNNYFLGGTRYIKKTIYYPPFDSIMLPIVLTMADDKVPIQTSIKTFSRRDTLSGQVINDMLRPFVLNIDGNSLENSIDWYE